MKTCKKCNQDRPVDSFTVDVRYKDGRYPWCAECRAAYRREKRHGAKRDQTLAYFQDWREQHIDHVRTESLDYYHQHRDQELIKRRERQRDRWQNDPAYRAMKNAFKKERYHSNPEFNKKKKAWSLITVHRRRARIKNLDKHFTQAEWRALCAKYDHRCLCCNETKPLTPDHVTPIATGGSNAIDNIQPLCLECNVRKNAKTIDYRPDV